MQKWSVQDKLHMRVGKTQQMSHTITGLSAGFLETYQKATYRTTSMGPSGLGRHASGSLSNQLCRSVSISLILL